MSEGSYRVLVVDDEINHSQLLEMRLKTLGYGVETANSGISALEILQKADPPIDLIITDIMMPGMNGIGLVQSLQNDPKLRSIPMIAMTGFPEKSLITESFKYGIRDVLIKPFPFDELLNRAKQYLKPPS